MPDDTTTGNTHQQNQGQQTLNQTVELSAAMLTSMAANFSLQSALLGVQYYDGENMDLKNFIQDVRNGLLNVAAGQEGQYVAAVMGRLKGRAKDCTFGKDIATVDDLVKVLKARFATGKNYTYYVNQINGYRMKANERVGDFCDRLNIFISGAKNALEKDGHPPENIEVMVEPLKTMALDAFIRGLPRDIALMVETCHPKTLNDACEEAMRLEARMDAGIIPDTRPGSLNKLRLEHQYSEYPNPGNQNYNYNPHQQGYRLLRRPNNYYYDNVHMIRNQQPYGDMDPVMVNDIQPRAPQNMQYQPMPMMPQYNRPEYNPRFSNNGYRNNYPQNYYRQNQPRPQNFNSPQQQRSNNPTNSSFQINQGNNQNFQQNGARRLFNPDTGAFDTVENTKHLNYQGARRQPMTTSQVNYIQHQEQTDNVSSSDQMEPDQQMIETGEITQEIAPVLKIQSRPQNSSAELDSVENLRNPKSTSTQQ